MKRIGILGGTFNPVHMGHLAIAQAAVQTVNLDKVFFVPSHTPPHKRIASLASVNDRYQMVKLAILGNPKFSLSDFEVKRPGKSYTIDTLKFFQEKYVDAQIYVIIGADMVEGLSAWKDIDEILAIASFLVFDRPGSSKHLPDDIIKGRTQQFISLQMPELAISSSFLRTQVKKRKSIKYLVPDKVFEYIIMKKLYLDQY